MAELLLVEQIQESAYKTTWQQWRMSSTSNSLNLHLRLHCPSCLPLAPQLPDDNLDRRHHTKTWRLVPAEQPLTAYRHTGCHNVLFSFASAYNTHVSIRDRKYGMCQACHALVWRQDQVRPQVPHVYASMSVLWRVASAVPVVE